MTLLTRSLTEKDSPLSQSRIGPIVGLAYGLLMSGALAVTQLFVLAKRPCKRLKTIPAIAPLAKTTANIRSFLSSLAFILTAPRRSDYPPATPVDRIHRMGSRDGRSLLDKRGELRRSEERRVGKE